ncbi:hypothetical protein [Pseudomonas sp. NPDC008258]|uniref:hypothetical protein n=1 Tax=Pseudomonas sp. NPDC008258 TaxID=3364418 RepID=UPI0036E3E22F
MKFGNGFKAVALLFAGSAFLAGCGNDNADNKAATAKASAPAVDSHGMTAEGRKAAQEFEDMNKPLRTEFSAPEVVDGAAYLNVLSKTAALQIYTAKRGWAESDEEIAKSASGAILIQSELPELYKLEEELGRSDDAFEKHDLTEKIAGLIKNEAEKINGNIRVKMTVNADLKSFDFGSKTFVSENCLMSEKLEYTKEDNRSPDAFARAQKPRCYLQPSITNFLVGVINGSKLNLVIADESIARKIESARAGAKFEVYGYVASVERERLGGTPRDARYVMIDPQRVNLISKENGETLYSQTF